MERSTDPREEHLSGSALEFYQACKELIDRGFFVFPCRQNKQPFTPHGYKDATQDLDEVFIWAQDLPDAQPAAACEMSGLMVVDIDDPEAYEAFLAKHGLDEPQTLAATTPSGGRHLYFRAEEGAAPAGQLCPGVDLKYRGYVLAPPATAISKRAGTLGQYQWVDVGHEIAPMPHWPGLVSKGLPPVEGPTSPLLYDEDTVKGETSLAELQELLLYIPPDISRPEWLPVLGAVYAATHGSSAGLELADRWSAGGEKYKPGEVDRIWKTLSSHKSAGTPYIAAKAGEYGADLGAIHHRHNPSSSHGVADISGLLGAADSGDAKPEPAPHMASLAVSEAEERVRQRVSVLQSNTVSGDQVEPNLGNDYLVKHWLFRNETCVLYGPTNVGKTFVVLNIAHHIASHTDWNGNRVMGGPVIYLASEGGRALMNRMVALPGGPSADFHLVTEAIDLFSDDIDVQAIVRLCHDILGVGVSPALIVIDTLARSMGNADENTAKDMNVVYKRVDSIRRQTGASVLLVHHSGKDVDRGSRGSTSLPGAVDTVIVCGKKDGLRYIESDKQRNGENGLQAFFQLEPYVLGIDADGDEKTTCYAKFLEAEAAAGARKVKGKNQVKVLGLLEEFLSEAAELHCADPAYEAHVKRDAFIEYAAPQMGKGTAKQGNRAVREALDALQKMGQIVDDGTCLSIPSKHEPHVS